jgi:hypothetical protein
MQTSFRTLMLLLVAAVIAAPLAVQGLLLDRAAARQLPAGCHEDGGNIPVPAPASHSCCQVGHHPAILQQSSASRPSLQISAQVESCQDAAVVAVSNSFPSIVIESGSPPVMSPLRV